MGCDGHRRFLPETVSSDLSPPSVSDDLPLWSPSRLSGFLEGADRRLREAGVLGVPLREPKPRGRAVFIGDTEGRPALTRRAFARFLPDQDTTIVFLGDYIDRGPDGIENVCELLGGALIAPDRVVLLRGNHETEDVTPHDFTHEMTRKYGTEIGDALYDRVMRIFAQLPYAAAVNQFFCVHGGIPDPVPMIADLRSLPMGRASLMVGSMDNFRPEVQLLWNDVAPVKAERHLNARGFLPNDSRGCGKLYGRVAVERFLAQNHLRGIIRGHERVETVIGLQFDGKVITINETGSSDSAPKLQGFLLLDAGRLRAEIFPSAEMADPPEGVVELAAMADRAVNETLREAQPDGSELPH